jgi:DNA-binding MarR family transcriptional regulator
MIYKSDSIRITDLAKELGMDRTTLTRNLSVLERQGFIKISSGKDNRTRIVAITSKGRTTVAKAIPLWNEVQRKVKQNMGEALWGELMDNLSQFVKVADQLNESK